MTAVTTSPVHTAPVAVSHIRPRPTGFVHDTLTIAGRALRAVPRDL